MSEHEAEPLPGTSHEKPAPRQPTPRDFEMLIDILHMLSGRDAPSPLFHYTSAEALHGIVSKWTLFATDLAFLNDPEEGLFALRRFLETSKDRIERGDDYAKTVVQPLFDLMIKSPVFPYGQERAFVASFSTRSDHLDQWRAYGCDGAGYAIGIRPGALKLD